MRQNCETLNNVLLAEFDYFSRVMVDDFENMMLQFLQQQAEFHKQVSYRCSILSYRCSILSYRCSILKRLSIMMHCFISSPRWLKNGSHCTASLLKESPGTEVDHHHTRRLPSSRAGVLPSPPLPAMGLPVAYPVAETWTLQIAVTGLVLIPVCPIPKVPPLNPQLVPLPNQHLLIMSTLIL